MTGDGALMIAPGATRRDTSGDSADLVWPDDGRRVRLGRAALALMSQFAVPATVEAVTQRLERATPGSAEAVRRAIGSLVDAGVLCEYGLRSPSSPATAPGLFDAPVVSVAEAVNSGADFVVIGAPYDHGATYRPGSRFAPASLRRASPTVFRLASDRAGMYDAELDARLLAGVGIADIGDLAGTPGALGQDILDGVQDVVALVAGNAQVPVVLGGDHSITLRVIDGLAEQHERIGVLHFDAHHDYGQVREGERINVHHGNFLDWVVGNPAVECVAQFGIRQLTPNPPESSPKLRRWPGLSVAGADIDDIVRQLPGGLVWHLTFDVDVLDPSVMPSTGTILPGGYTYRQAVATLTALCRSLPVVAIDVVEYLPDASEAPAITVAGLLARIMHHVAAARGQR